MVNALVNVFVDCEVSNAVCVTVWTCLAAGNHVFGSNVSMTTAVTLAHIIKTHFENPSLFRHYNI
jgi:hypothetical protein